MEALHIHFCEVCRHHFVVVPHFSCLIILYLVFTSKVHPGAMTRKNPSRVEKIGLNYPEYDGENEDETSKKYNRRGKPKKLFFELRLWLMTFSCKIYEEIYLRICFPNLVIFHSNFCVQITFLWLISSIVYALCFKGPLQKQAMKYLIPFSSNASPTLPITTPRKDDQTSYAEEIIEGRQRRRSRSSGVNTKKILLVVAIMWVNVLLT